MPFRHRPRQPRLPPGASLNYILSAAPLLAHVMMRIWLHRVVEFVRDVWLIAGIVLLLFLGLDRAYVGQAAVRHAVQRLRGVGDVPVHPNAGLPWWREWEARAGAVNGPARYDPYRGWWALPYASAHVHVDSAGRRLTVNVAKSPGAPKVYMLGGSVMWGYTSRDSFTIPSLVAARLAAVGVGPVEVVSLAQPSYNATQGVITLLLELRRGGRPAVVVSLDGNNDVLAAFQEGHPGAAIDEAKIARLSPFGHRGFWAGLLGLARYSALVQRIQQTRRPERAPRPEVPSPAACPEVAGQYRNLVLAVAGLGREFGFTPIYVWQPHWATTRKPLTGWERSIRSWPGFVGLLEGCTRAVDSLMQDEAGRTFVSLSSIFDHDTATVFLDEFGHMTEEGNARVAAAIADLVAPALKARPLPTDPS